MTVQNMWPLAFLALIPVIILLYLLKQKAKDEPFSSTMLWQEIYKNLEAKTPFEKLKQNILMYLQILLMLLLILALMAPIWKKGGAAQENVVLVMDNSASMQYLYDSSDTRLEHSVKEAKREIDSMSEDTTVTLIESNSEAAVLYQGKDKNTLKKRLEQMEPTMNAGNPDVAAGVVNSVIAGMDNVQIICYTDTDFAYTGWTRQNDKAALIVQDMFSTGENCSLDYVNYAVDEDGVEALCRITNYGEREVSQDVSLYVNGEIADIQPVTIDPQESAIVYFGKQRIATDGSAVLKAELSEKDSLTEDNSQSIVVTADTQKKILLLSEGNVFLEKALALDDSVEVYKSEDSGVLKQKEDSYDLYVLDGISLPEALSLSDFPATAGFLFFNFEKDFCGTGYIETDSEVSGAVLSFQSSPVTQYVEDYAFGITKAYTYTLPEWAVPIIKNEEGGIAGYYGTVEGHPVAVLGFDIHNTDLALQTEFPIFMSQLGDMLSGSGVEYSEIVNFPVTEESNVSPVDPVVVEGSQKQKKTGGRAIRNLILMLAVVLLVVEWIVYVRQVRSTKRNQFLVVRCLVLLAVILAMAGVSVPKKQKKSETIFLVDISDSMSGNQKELEAYLRKTVSDMPEHNLCGIVVFGKDTAVEQFLSDRKVFSTFTVNPVTAATNIEKAVQTAASMFDEGAGKRLVLITDGNENEGSMSLSATTIKGNDVELFTVTMEDSIGGNDEVYINGLTAPRVIHAGDHYNVTVSVTSNVETDARLSLYAGRNLKGQQDIHVNKGRNQFVFEDVGEEGAIAQYKAVIEPENDTISVNNTYVTFSQIEAKPKVLLIEGKAGEGNEFEKVLTAANIEYDKVTPKGAPVTISELNRYKAVITLDVYYDDLKPGFVDSLESYVKDFAGGYICIGGENSYALGNYRDTVLEELLPVYMDLQGEKEIPKMAMAMVIDQSGSMVMPAVEDSTVTGLDLAKQAAISGVSELRNTDEIGVMAFDDTYHWIVPMQQASDVEQIKDEIRTIAEGGGTSIYPALQQAYEQILSSDAKLKHIILLTDGQDGFTEYDDLINLINQAGITVSTVAVGSDSDQNLLSNLAQECGGRFYYTDINNSIPRIFAQEVYLSTNTYLVNGEFYPTITSSNELLSGVMEEGCPALLGYVATTPKQTTDVILESDQGDPLLSTWQCGLGRTVAWASDGNNEWTAEYAGWDRYPMLWSNLVNYVLSDTELGDDDLEVVKEGNTATVSYETKEYDKNTKVNAVITDENGNTKEVSLDAVKPGAFEAVLDMDEVGVYSVSVRKQADGEVIKSYNTAYANQYSAEYQFNSADSDFATFVKQAGGTEVTLEDDIWSKNQKAVPTRVSLTVPLLMLAVFLFLFDIIIRRFSVDMLVYVQKGWNVIKTKMQSPGRKKPVLHEETEHLREEHLAQRDAAVSRTEDVQQATSADTADMEIKGKRRKEQTGKKAERKAAEPGKRQDVQSQSQNEKLDMNQLLKKKQERNQKM
ncbi:MAG: VWA domain-containing protein [Lachnospiraceae bacterium]|nr:VWA domain-containing protein [Lachnospiraceae bacterium]